MQFVLIKGAIFIAYFVSFTVVVIGLTAFSRLHIFGTCVIFLMLELLCFNLYVSLRKNKIDEKIDSDELAFSLPKISVFLLVSDFLLLSFSFYFMNYIIRGSFSLSPDYEMLILLIIGLWLLVSYIAHKFDMNNFQNYYYAMASCIKSAILIVLIMSVVIFAFRLFHFSVFHVFGTFFVLLLLESVLYYFYFVIKFGKNLNGDIDSVERRYDFLEQKDLPTYKEDHNKKSSFPKFMNLIIERCLKLYPEILEFLSDATGVSKIEHSETAIMDSNEISNVEILENHSVKIFMNLCRINDIRWINRYFLEAHKKIFNGGYFLGKLETLEEHKRKFFKKYPKYYAEFLYFFHFLFFRVCPKLTEIKKIYFHLTKGKNRIISKAEILGRLYFCGFKVVAEREINGSLYFVAQKVKTPSLDQSPSYAPLVKLKRIGLNGRIICIYKFRTMFPYSEYLQEYIYHSHKLDEGGKIKDDFRITEWGSFMRKYWLDEIPMIYNWIRGEIKFFGVRPLSIHYFGLYDTKLKEMRKSVKPGLIPPFYTDLPTRFTDIVESERKYIREYQKNPLKTQCIYFMKALNNIIFRGARSN